MTHQLPLDAAPLGHRNRWRALTPASRRMPIATGGPTMSSTRARDGAAEISRRGDSAQVAGINLCLRDKTARARDAIGVLGAPSLPAPVRTSEIALHLYFWRAQRLPKIACCRRDQDESRFQQGSGRSARNPAPDLRRTSWRGGVRDGASPGISRGGRNRSRSPESSRRRRAQRCRSTSGPRHSISFSTMHASRVLRTSGNTAGSPSPTRDSRRESSRRWSSIASGEWRTRSSSRRWLQRNGRSRAAEHPSHHEKDPPRPHAHRRGRWSAVTWLRRDEMRCARSLLRAFDGASAGHVSKDSYRVRAPVRGAHMRSTFIIGLSSVVIAATVSRVWKLRDRKQRIAQRRGWVPDRRRGRHRRHGRRFHGRRR